MHLRQRLGFGKQKLKQMEREDMQEASTAERMYDFIRNNGESPRSNATLHPLLLLLLLLLLLPAGAPPCPNAFGAPCFAVWL